MATDVIVYVDPDNGPGTDYTTMDAMEDAWAGVAGSGDLVGEDVKVSCYCQSTGTTEDSAVVDFVGWTSTDADHDILVEVPLAYRHRGKWEASASGMYKGNRTGGNAGIQIRMNDITLRGLSERNRTLQFKGTIEIRVTADNIHIEDCLFHELSGTATNVYGLYIHSITTGSKIYVRNCLAYKFAGTGSKGFFFTTNSNFDIYMYFCSAINNETGFQSGGATQNTHAKNCFSWDNTTPYGDVRWGTSEYCCYESGSGIGTNKIDVSGFATADMFTDYASEDYTVIAGSALYELGTSLAADSNYPVIIDYAGEQRHYMPTPHFDEYPAPLSNPPSAREELQDHISHWSLDAVRKLNTYHPTS